MQKKVVIIILSAIAAVLMLASLRMPVWQMHMEAPQYQDEEALNVKVYPNALRGDMDELKVLNNYIGVHVPEELPQNRWLPPVLVAGAVAGFLVSFLPARARKRALFLVPTLVALALLAAAAQAQWQMYEIGTKRDEKTTMLGVKDFTTPLVGRTKVAQFTITSFLSWGSLAIGGALALQWIGAWLSGRSIAPPSREADPDGPAGFSGGLALDSPRA